MTGEGGEAIHARIFWGVLVLAAVLAFAGLGRHAFWHDEAHTALFGRNLLATGERTAWDGTNLVGYGGGVELSEDLKFLRAPPQEQVAAAFGMALFGETRFGARFFFPVFGVLGIAALGWCARSFLGNRFPWWLPALLVALSPAYLLYIRNCRYYAPGIFYALLLWAAWCAAMRSQGKEEPDGKARAGKGFALFAGVAAVSALGICTSQYVYAVTAPGILPLFLLDRRFRTRKQIFLLAGLGVLVIGCMLTIILVANPFQGSTFEGAGEGSSLFRKIAVLGWWQIRDLGFFEFFALPMLLPLFLPWVSPRFGLLRETARRGWVLVAVFFGIIILTAAVSPQELLFIEGADIRAEIRHSLPLIPVGAMIAAVSLGILWRVQRFAAVTVAGVLVFTNLFHLGATGDQPRHEGGGSRVRSTLLDYVREATRPYVSVYDALIEAAEPVPAGTTVRFFPYHLAYPLMFERPDLHYTNQLEPSVAVRPELRVQLPPYVLSNYLPDLSVVYGPLQPPAEPGKPDQLVMLDLPQDLPQFLSQFQFRQMRTVPVPFPIGARPEIPRRRFAAPAPGEGRRGAFVFFARGEDGARP